MARNYLLARQNSHEGYLALKQLFRFHIFSFLICGSEFSFLVLFSIGESADKRSFTVVLFFSLSACACSLFTAELFAEKPKKEFKRLKMPNLSILFSKAKEKTLKNPKKLLQILSK